MAAPEGRARAAGEGAQRVRGRRLRRAADRQGRRGPVARHQDGRALRARDARRAAARRDVDRRRRARPRPRRRRRVHGARGQPDDAERLRLRDGGPRRAAARAQAGARRRAAQPRRAAAAAGRRAAGGVAGRRASRTWSCSPTARTTRRTGSTSARPSCSGCRWSSPRTCARTATGCATASTASTPSTAAATPTGWTRTSGGCWRRRSRLGRSAWSTRSAAASATTSSRTRTWTTSCASTSARSRACARSRRWTSGAPTTSSERWTRFGELVIKPRSGSGGHGVMVCPHADPADVEERRDRVQASPREWVAQPFVSLSRHPTVVDGVLVATSCRPATVRVHARPRPPARAARRAHPVRARRGGDGGQHVPGRRLQGHMGALGR